MQIVPAIDLKGGRCVRLYQGDYSKETVFSEDPVSMALHWQSQGAQRLHIVDLDGAAQGEVRHASVISDIVRAVDIPVQLGGGIRTIETIESVLGMGVERVILGTAALENRELVVEGCMRFADGIIVGVDARDGCVATRGWLENSSVRAIELIEGMERIGVKRFIYTDISRDGTLTEPNFSAVEELVSHCASDIIAAGGISSIEHLQKLAGGGAAGAIVGRALYTGHIDLAQALDALNKL